MEQLGKEFVKLRMSRTGKTEEVCQKEWDEKDGPAREKQAVLLQKYIYENAEKKADDAKAMLETYLGFKDVKICKNYSKAQVDEVMERLRKQALTFETENKGKKAT